MGGKKGTVVGFSQALVPPARDIRDRFVHPDVDTFSPAAEPSLTDHSPHFSAVSQFAIAHNSDNELDDLIQSDPSRASDREGPRSEAPERIPLGDWLLAGRKLLLLGSAGFGKSMVLRCLALDLLTTPVAFPEVAARLRGSLPLLIPFAVWNRLTASKAREVSVKEVAVETYASAFPGGGGRLEALIEHAQQNKQLLLLIDGLDEYQDEQAARTTLLTINTLAQTHELITLCSGRPSVLRKLGILGSDWRLARLQELTRAQQKDLVTHLLTNTVCASDRSLPEGRVDRKADPFFAHLDRNSRMRTLAGTPLSDHRRTAICVNVPTAR